MSIQKDRQYWRVKYWDEMEGEGMNKYFGTDKATALAHAIAICGLKIEKWENRRKEYQAEYKALMSKALSSK